jgi:hypothetical protein
MVKALLVPADHLCPVEEIKIGGEADIRPYLNPLDGPMQCIDSASDVKIFSSADGPWRNERASSYLRNHSYSEYAEQLPHRFLTHGLRGFVVIVGYDPITGDLKNVPERVPRLTTWFYPYERRTSNLFETPESRDFSVDWVSDGARCTRARRQRPRVGEVTVSV